MGKINNRILFIIFKRLNNTIKILVLFIFFLLFSFSSAFALSTGGVGGYPAHPDPSIPRSESWFVFSLDLGEIGEDDLLIFNTSDETKTVKLYAVDSVPSNQGNFALANEDAEKKDLGAWVEISESFVTLEPGESREIPFTITIPDDADVGEHSGGIIIQKSNQDEAMGQTGASIVTRVGIRIYNTVPGEIIKEVELTNFGIELVESENKKPFYKIAIAALNKSTVSLNPKVDLEITGWGKIDYFTRSNFNAQEGIIIDFKDLTDFFSGVTLTKNWQLLREQEVNTHWEWPKPEFGRFTFQVKMTYEGNDGEDLVLTSQAISIWVIPWVEVSVVGGIIALIILLIIIKKIFSKTKKWQPYKVRKGDQLVSLAQIAGVKWKKVAKVNKLKNPLLKEGQVIMLPAKFKAKPIQPTKIKKLINKDNQTKNNNRKR